MRIDRLLLGLLLPLGACGDPEPTVPSEQHTLYRLESVNGETRLPYFDSTRRLLFFRSDLLLREGRQFTLGVAASHVGSGASNSTFEHGNVERQATGARFIRASGSQPTEWTGIVADDSVVIDLSPPPFLLRFTYRRAVKPTVKVADGKYALAAINGRRDQLLLLEAITPEQTGYPMGYRRVHRVLFDTLTFTDGAFYRRSRAEANTVYTPTGDSIPSAREWALAGSYTGTDPWIVLSPYAVGVDRSADSLIVKGTTIIRQRSGVEELYERIP
jgi:hypothetical protein